jgi:hypothetical protein
MLYQSDSFSSTKQHQKGEDDMTKAKARQRKKAKAAQKARKQDADADRPGQKIRPGQFDPGAGSIKGPSASASTRTFAGARRGAARSR